MQHEESSRKVLIIGSGAAGCTAAIYAARAGLCPLLIAGFQPGGQLTITTDVENYPGFAKTIQGPKLMEEMQQQAKNSGAEVVSDEIVEINFNNDLFHCAGMFGSLYSAETVIVATGAQAKWLGLESEEEFKGYGVSACATCDGTFFKNKKVVVVGGGNTAVEEALYLAGIASKVIVVHRRNELRAEAVMQKRLFENPKIEVIWNHIPLQIIGNQSPKKVTDIDIKSTVDDQVQRLSVDGIFVAIGHSPNTSVFKDLVKIDRDGYIITTSNSTHTSHPGVFAAGDVKDKVYRQAVVAAGTGCMAALDAEKFLVRREWPKVDF